MAGLPSRIKNKNRKPKASREFTNEYQFRFALLTKVFLPLVRADRRRSEKVQIRFYLRNLRRKFLAKSQKPKAKSEKPKAKSQEPLAPNDPNLNTI
jgi:hypothetical protein